MEKDISETFERAAAFQKMWLQSLGSMGQIWSTVTPGEPPPEMAKRMRSGILKVLAESWDEFMRTPEFLEAMKTTFDQSLEFRKMSNDVMTRALHEMQAPARADTDNVLKSVKHLERRLLDEIEELDGRLGATDSKVEQLGRNGHSDQLRESMATLDKELSDRLGRLEGDVEKRLDALADRLDSLQAQLAALTARPAPSDPVPAVRSLESALAVRLDALNARLDSLPDASAPTDTSPAKASADEPAKSAARKTARKRSTRKTTRKPS